MILSLIRKLIGGLSFTSVLFVFQACYGTLQDYEHDVLIKGTVTSKLTGTPIPGIRVTVTNSMQYQHTDEDGKYSLYTILSDNYLVKFHDIDSLHNGNYIDVDTSFAFIENHMSLDIAMEEK